MVSPAVKWGWPHSTVMRVNALTQIKLFQRFLVLTSMYEHWLSHHFPCILVNLIFPLHFLLLVFSVLISNSLMGSSGILDTDESKTRSHLAQQWLFLMSRCIVCMKEKEWVKVTQSCLTLCDPMDYTVHGILRARILQRVAVPFSRGSSQPRDQTQVSLIAGVFYTS